MRVKRFFLASLWLGSILLLPLSIRGTVYAHLDSDGSSEFNAGSITGLNFPGSAAVRTSMRFKFTNPQNNGLPIYGVDGRGITYIWRAYPRQQDGYYTAFFWGNDDGQNNLNTFLWKRISGVSKAIADSYYGAHPYPRRSNRPLHDWEISVEQEDYVNGQVVYDRWYTQCLRVWSTASNRKFHEFYWDLPKTDASHTVMRVSPASWGNINPPAPALTWGDAPWAPGKEVWKGILRGIQIYSGLLSVTDILREASNPLSTSAGADNIWYLNVNPKPSDISDKSGRGHNPAWVGNERPSLYRERTPNASKTGYKP